ncbi:MAG: hypothetical protein VXY92_07635 [Planctomycetota bacterium]|nr:hypothetical protein [Planctomycetota bacterium]
MRQWCGIGPVLWLFMAACAGVAPDPAAVSIDALPLRELSEDARARCAALEQSAIEAVVQRQYVAAEEAANAALEIDPRSARAHAVRGMVTLQQAAAVDPIEWRGLRQGESEMAVARLLAPADAFVGWLHAVFLSESGHVSAAAAAAEAALERCADAPAAEKAALLGIAGTYRYELGEERAAVPHLEAYPPLRPRAATAQFRLGACLLVMSKTLQGVPPPYRVGQSYAEQAADAFRRCVELAPGDEDASSSIAAALLRAAELARLKPEGDPASRAAEAALLEQQALDHLRTVTERFPDSAEARFRLGVVAGQLRQAELAQQSYRDGLARDPSHAGCLMNLAAMASERGDRDEARGLLLRLLAAEDARQQLTSEERQLVQGWLDSK